MATGSGTDGGPGFVEQLLTRLSAPRTLGQRLLEELVYAPGRSAAIALVVAPYLWLLWFVVTTTFGLRGDPVPTSDWLTLVFTSYALLSSLALAHRILTVGLGELTEEYLVDALALTWLTGFYFVWMMARQSVAQSTTTTELYGPVLDGRPDAVASAVLLGSTALVTVWLIRTSRGKTKLFETEFRTALVTLPGLVTVTVLLSRPGADSLVWPLVGGVFVGTLLGGLLRIQRVASWIAKGGFAVCSLGLWTLGATAWALVYRSRPPNDHVVLERVGDDPAHHADAADETARNETFDDD